jgi:transposase-like protein
MTEPLSEDEVKAQERAKVIWAVRSGKLTVAEGAASLGISRQCYYGWEERALAGMADALLERQAGRPEKQPSEDPETERLRKRLAELEREVDLLRQSAAVREVLSPFPEWRPKKPDSEKKGRK